MKIKIIALFLILGITLSGCRAETPTPQKPDAPMPPDTPSVSTDLGGDNTSFGGELDELGVYGGYFEGEAEGVDITCVSGTQGAYKLEENTITFTAIETDSVYSISGQFKGNIIIDVGNNYKFDLEMNGFSLISEEVNPITVISGNEVAIKAKSGTENYIYDNREAIDSTDETLYSGAIHSEVDLEISGKGTLNVVSENNNGIHSKDDLQVKNLTLYVACIDNALKGNDGVEMTGGKSVLIASAGDAIKTSKSDVSEKGNQRGSITITGGEHTIYAACDGIDAAYNVIIDDESTVLNVYTDKYSNYSSEVTVASGTENYIRFTSNAYKYSVKYYNSDSDYVWVTPQYHSSVSGRMTNYYYYSFPKMDGYGKMQFFIYSTEMEQGQEEEFLVKSDYLTPNSGCDTFALTAYGNQLMYDWTNYTTQIQEGGFGGGKPGMGGPGGMNDGNADKGTYSTKGIKAANEIVMNAGTVSVKSYDDAIHANADTVLENGETPLGNITVNGGNITVYSNDDGLHADGDLLVNGGSVNITNAYEGIEGTRVSISGGDISVRSADDGINATTTSGTAISISGGRVYIYCSGDGIDSNSISADVGIVFAGGQTVVISNSSMNSAIDTENGYTYEAGQVVAIMPRGMVNEAVDCRNFNSIGKYTSMSLTAGSFLVADIGETTATIEMPCSISGYVIILGDSSITLKTESSISSELDTNGVAWK